MSRIPPHIIDEIMQTSRIEEVIGEFVHLKRAGSNLKGLSPFTDEKTPSFVVSPAKQIFKCFSTGKGGSVVTFLMEKEHYSYPEALKWLANKYNITLPEEREPTAEELAQITEKESLFIINEFARNHFVERMHETDEGKAVGLNYFIERGFRKDIIEKFQLGYCLEKGNDFTENAIQKGYKLEYLEKIGLIKSKDNRHFDFFRGRVMFPIHSVSGRVLGFGGRTLLADKKIAKYFNSPESVIYNKSDILYGLYYAKGDIVKYDNCYLVEGYTDVISMHQAGIINVVSSSGTSLTHGQIKLIRRYTQNVTILYDGDAAGIKASFRGIDLLLEEGLNVRVVLFPDGDDPDSYSKKVSNEELNQYIKSHMKDFVSFKAEILLGENGVQDPIQRAKLIHDIVHSISLIPDEISRTVYSQEISKRFEIDINIIHQELFKLRKNQLAKQQATNTPQQALEPEIPTYESATTENQSTQTSDTKHHFISLDHAEYDLIRILVKYGVLAIEIEITNEFQQKTKIETSVTELVCAEIHKDQMFFENTVFQRLFNEVNESLNQEKRFLKPSHFLKSTDIEIVKLVSDIENEPYELSHNWLKEKNIETNYEIDKLSDAVLTSIYHFKMSRIIKRIYEIQSELANLNAANDDEFASMSLLLMEQVKLEQVKTVLSKALGRTIL
ncbi:MAG: DNA primase [Crocinitomicaceae bacterium]|jgi:DNA primase